MQIITEDKLFIYNVQRKHDLKYWSQYFMLTVLDWLYKSLFLFHHESKPKQHTLSICAIFKNEASYMKEWIEYYILMGVDHFYLYNNNSEDNFEEVLAPYVEKGVITLQNWPDIPGQISAYRHWYENYRHETNWCSFLDLDEFLCPLQDENLKQWLNRHKKYPLYAIYWKIFGTSGKISPETDKLVIEQYTNCWDKLATATKLIYNTDYDIEQFFTSMMHKFNVKYMGMSIPPINQFGFFINHWEIHRHHGRKHDIQCNHYWSKSYSEYVEKHKRGDAVWKDGKSVRTQKMFLWHEHFNRGTDVTIQRFLVELKLKMNRYEKDLD